MKSVHALSLLILLLLLGGCASQTDEEEDAPIRFVVIAAPAIGGEPEDAELTHEDLLLEAVTQLSTEDEIDFSLVPGPLLGSNDEESRESLIGGVGSLAAVPYVALGPDDGPPEELLELLAETLARHDGEAAYLGKAVRGVRPVVLDPQGQGPEPEEGEEEDDDDDPPTLIALQGGAAGVLEVALTVLSGPELLLESGPRGARLVVPPLTQPPHIYVIATLTDGELQLSLRSALDLPVPAPPASVRLTPATSR